MIKTKCKGNQNLKKIEKKNQAEAVYGLVYAKCLCHIHIENRKIDWIKKTIIFWNFEYELIVKL